MPVKLTRADRERVTEQARALWFDVFTTLETQYPELQPADPAQVASLIETTFVDRMTNLLGVTVTDEQARLYHDAPTPGLYLCGHRSPNGDVDLNCATCHSCADSAQRPIFVLNPDLGDGGA